MLQVQHRAAARGHRVARRNGLDDVGMLAAHSGHEVDAARLVAARDAHAFAQVLLQKAEQQAELRVTGRVADHAVKSQVFGHTVFTGCGRLVDGLQRTPQRGDLRACGAFGRECGDLAFEHAPHLDHMHHRLHRVEHARVEFERPVHGRVRHEHPEPLPRTHQLA